VLIVAPVVAVHPVSIAAAEEDLVVFVPLKRKKLIPRE
jgi:hypothetical protein